MRLALVVGVALVSSAAAAPRPGRVVRVERHARAVIGTPRFCIVASDGNGRCIGKPPSIGDRIDVLDTTKPIGSVRVTAVAPAPDMCNQRSMWQIESTIDSGDLTAARGDAIGVLDLPIDRRVAHMVDVDHSPTGQNGDQIYAIDEDGDGTVDVEFVEYGCDDNGTPSPNPTGACSDVWASSPHGLERIRQDRFRNCL